MKAIFTLFTLLFTLIGNSQIAILQGRVRDSTQNGFIQNAQLKFIKNDTTIYSSPNGNYRIQLGKYLEDTIVVSHWKYGTKLIAVSLLDKMLKDLDIILPVSCKSIPNTDICPKCKSNRSVIEIIYGYPTESNIRRADKEEIRLGGCMINDCIPYHYCKLDKLEF